MSVIKLFSSKIIGGMFALADTSTADYTLPNFMNSDSILLANARSGFALVIELLSPARVWMPSYFCNHVLHIIEEYTATIEYYEIDRKLTISELQWLDRVQPNDLVIMVDYFGFPCDQECKKKVKELGAWLLEDACQALLSADVGEFADFVIYSPRKFLGIPDGGILTTRHNCLFEDISLKSPPAKWWLMAFEASRLRKDFDLYGGGRHWFELFRETEETGPCGRFAMSELSKLLLLHCFDYERIAATRVENYKLLASELEEFSLFPSLPHGVVPLGFPLCLKDRDRIRQVLFKHDVYPPVHWLIKGVIPENFKDSHELSDEIMTLPCDQRYEATDMEQMISILLKEIEQ